MYENSNFVRYDMLCVDLYSGLGGFSQAFIDRGWHTIRIDNDIRFKAIPNTIIGDVHYLPLKKCNPDILLIAPPCNKLSIARVYDNWDNGIPKNDGVVMALRLVTYALDAVDYLEPKYWVLENPRGMLRRILGNPKITTYFASWGALWLKPTDLWGRFPPNMVWPKPKKWVKAPRGSNKGLADYIRDPAKRALIPYPLSEALAIAVENSIGNEHTKESCPYPKSMILSGGN